MSNETLYLSTLAFLDDEALTTNDRYLLEFCKIVTYQNGYMGLSLQEVCSKVNELVCLGYTENEVEKLIEEYPEEIEVCNGMYYITSKASEELGKRERTFSLRKYVDAYCDCKMKNETNLDRSSLCDLVTKFIFEKFQQNLDQISSIIDGNKENQLDYGNDYSEKEKDFLNSFLFWDNEEKNKMIYDLIVKSYDFCTINCTNPNIFDFKQFHFYLDANIVMRLMGINNEYRKNVVQHFIDKCKESNINLHITCFTKQEIKKSIERQINAIKKDLNERQYIPSPDGIRFAKSESFTIELYEKYYEYINKHKGHSFEAFKRYLNNQVDSCIGEFIYDECNSFELTDNEKYSSYMQALSSIKDISVIKTDVNNIMFLEKVRKEQDDSYIISADAKLINWCKEVFFGQSSFIDLPSTWLSIITKYTGRTTSTDYASFCKFIRLPIYHSDKDIERKIKIKKNVLKMDIVSSMKNRILEEIDREYTNYDPNISEKKLAEKAYEKTMQEHDEQIRKKEEKNNNEKIERLNRNLEELTKELSVEKNNVKEITNTYEMNSISNKIEKIVDIKYKKRIELKENLSKHKKRIIFISCLLIVIATNSLVFFITQKININIINFVITLMDFLVALFVPSILDALIETLGDEEEFKEKHRKKLKKKYKELLD